MCVRVWLGELGFSLPSIVGLVAGSRLCRCWFAMMVASTVCHLASLLHRCPSVFDVKVVAVLTP